MKIRLLALPLLVALFAAPTSALGAGDPIMPLDQVHAGMDCTGKTVVQGTTISSFNVHVIDVVRGPGTGAGILVRVSGPAVDVTGVAEGFSGSPVYCTDSAGTARNIGAIAQSVGEYGNKVVLVTPIQSMLGEPVAPPSSAPSLRVRTRPLLGPLTVSGLSPWLLAVLQRAASRAGRTVLAAPSASPLFFAPQPLVPGASVSAMYSLGDIALGALGTVTYRDGNNVYAFGHPLDDAGRRSLLLADAYVYDVVANPGVDFATSYKLASPGHAEGTLTNDNPEGVIGQLGALPPVIPVHVAARDLDTGRTLALRTDVADETGVGLPNGTSFIDTVAPLAVAQAGTAVFDGDPANQSGDMCFRVEIRESSRPLRFCNRYVGSGGPGDGGGDFPPALASAAGNDVSTALGLLDNVQFANLHVTRVVANIHARRGLAQATIVTATAPVKVRAGKAVGVALKVRLFRGPLRTVRFALPIPRGLHGPVRATLSGPPNNANQGASLASLITALSGSFTGSSAPGGATPTSIAALRRQFDAVGHYDGLHVKFSPSHRGSGATSRRHAYRDARLVITGRATLHFVVG